MLLPVARVAALLSPAPVPVSSFEQFRLFEHAAGQVAGVSTRHDAELISKEAVGQPCYQADLSRLLLAAFRANSEQAVERARGALFSHLFGIPGFHAVKDGQRLFRAADALANSLIATVEDLRAQYARQTPAPAEPAGALRFIPLYPERGGVLEERA